MKYGNCLIGLILILLNTTEKGRIIIRKSDYGFVPHLLFRTKEKIYHYKLIKDVLPWPFCYILFKGEFRCHERSSYETIH